jgi:hypothetical protein
MAFVEKELFLAKFDALHNEIEALRELKAHDFASILVRFDEGKLALATALAAVTDTNHKSDRAIEKRFDSVNEFRQTLSDQTQTFMTRSELLVTQDAQQREIESLKVHHARLATQTESNEKTIAVERAQLEQRFGSIDEFRLQLRDQSAKYLTHNEFDANHRPLADKVDEMGRPNYTMLVAATSVLLVVLGAAWAVIGLQISVATAPFATALAADSIDRAQLNAHVTRLDETISSVAQDLEKQVTALRLDVEKSKLERDFK